ncbi:MAG: hypothetical protein KBT27_09250 [Prevotellaceae bacterium]|nr:hypothetical protein [Candidatus Faecinaster equi]
MKEETRQELKRLHKKTSKIVEKMDIMEKAREEAIRFAKSQKYDDLVFKQIENAKNETELCDILTEAHKRRTEE